MVGIIALSGAKSSLLPAFALHQMGLHKDLCEGHYIPPVSHKKEWNFAISSIMDGLGGHDA